MAGLDFEYDLTEVYDLVGRLGKSDAVVRQEIDTAGRQSGMIVTQVAMGESPVDIGNLRASIGPPETNGMVTVITAHADYAKAVHDGTRAHPIVAHGKALKFPWQGRMAYFKSVMHPGTKANPFMARALQKALTRVQTVYEQAEMRAANRLLGG